MEGSLLQMEPVWQNKHIGDQVRFLAKVILWDRKGEKHLVRSFIGNQFIVVKAMFPKCEEITVLDGTVVDTTKGYRVDGHTGHILTHQAQDWTVLTKVAETCTGMGF